MGYFLQAIIGRQKTLLRHAADFRHARIITLAQGVAIIPLTDDLYDEIGVEGETGHFVKLSPSVEQWVRRISTDDPVAYIEAEFFGGIGSQSAVAWSGGSTVLGPVHAGHAINQALRLFRVQIGEAHDEFDAVDLGRHRDTHDWISGEVQ